MLSDADLEPGYWLRALRHRERESGGWFNALPLPSLGILVDSNPRYSAMNDVIKRAQEASLSLVVEHNELNRGNG